MQKIISKSKLKVKIIKSLRNVIKEKALLESLRNTVLYYQNPTEPVGEKDWEELKSPIRSLW